MASVVITGDTSGSITLAAPAVAGSNTITLPANTGTVITTASSGQSIPKAALPTGSVLQVVQGTYAGKVSTSSSSFVTTNLAASITPTSSSSKILATVTLVGCYTNASNRELSATLYRGATNLAPSGSSSNQALGWLYNPSAATGGNLTFSYLDSPATTSSTTYTVYFASAGSNAVDINENGYTSTIVLQEIAA